MSSNCFVIYDDDVDTCVIVDPGTEKCGEIIHFLDSKQLRPQYIILTHEHTDHTWGCNVLIDTYDVKVVCTKVCKELLPMEGKAYFQYYYDDPDYTYEVKRVDVYIEDVECHLEWEGCSIKFLITPGHSDGSVCFSINENLFTGDTIMQYKPFVSRKKGSMEEYRESVKKILSLFNWEKTIVYPGHGNSFKLDEWMNFKLYE